MALTLCERETIITFNEGESTANIYTASASMAKKLSKLGEVVETGSGWEVEVPKSWVVIRPPKK